MMQKNETLLLEAWITYHSSLLGSRNIYLYDNNSTEPTVIQALKNAERNGVNVLWQYKTQDDFLNRGEIISSFIKELDEEHPYDFYFLLDCDEFLACLTAGGSTSCLRQDILESLTPYLSAKEVLAISHKYCNNILIPNHYKITTSSKKCFFAQGTCQSLDHGYHHARSSKSKDEIYTRIVYFEFHYKPYAHQRQLNKQKLIGLVPNFSRKTLHNYVEKRQHSFHCAMELLQSKYEYMKDFQCSTDLVAEPVLLTTFDALGIEYANLFEYRSSIHRAFERKTLFLRHLVNCKLGFLTDLRYMLRLKVAGGLKRAYRRIATLLRG